MVANLNNWKIPPFKAVVRKGYLNGRGSQDMKGGVACWISAVSNFIKNKSCLVQGRKDMYQKPMKGVIGTHFKSKELYP